MIRSAVDPVASSATGGGSLRRCHQVSITASKHRKFYAMVYQPCGIHKNPRPPFTNFLRFLCVLLFKSSDKKIFLRKGVTPNKYNLLG